MNNSIAKSLATIRSIESNEVLNEAAIAAPAAAGAGKGIGRFIPGVGAALGAYDAYGRAKQGDWAGAGLSAAGGLASLIPGVGTAASIGIAGAQALRDKQRTGSYMPGSDEIAAGVAKDAAAPAPAVAQATPAAPLPPGADPKVLALQKQLIAKGAKITADGKMGPATQAAMKQFPGTAVAEHNKGNDMSESQRIAELRDRLAQIESQPQITDENWAKGAWDAGKGMFQAAKTGLSGAPVATGKLTKAGAPQMVGQGTQKFAKQLATKPKAQQAAYGAAKAVKNNPIKSTAAAAGLAGAAGMAALGGSAATKPADPAKSTAPAAPAAPAAPTAPPAPTANAGPDQADIDALNAMAQELENSQDPIDIDLLGRYNGIINAVNNGAKDDKRTIGQQAANADAGSEKEPRPS